MGGFLSRFRKKKETTEVLEELETDIKNCVNFRLENQESQRRWVGRFTLWGIVSYVIIALLYYLIYFPVGWVERIVYSTILIVVPVILILASRRCLMWYYSRKITTNEEKLLQLKEEKEKILEEVMETETYKKAKEILEKFDPERHKTMTPPRLSMTSTPGSELRHRKGGNLLATPKAPAPPNSAPLAIGPPPSAPSSASSSAQPTAPSTATLTPSQAGLNGNLGMILRPPNNTPIRPGTPLRSATPIRPLRLQGHPPINFSIRGSAPSLSQPPVLPRPVLPADRGVIDRMVEYLVGDGPTNRYALVCRRCHRHNGMALKEEFDYLAYHCAYCQFLNPAKRKRPTAPRLPESNPPSDSESESNVSASVSPNSRSTSRLPTSVSGTSLPTAVPDDNKPDDESDVKVETSEDDQSAEASAAAATSSSSSRPLESTVEEDERAVGEEKPEEKPKEVDGGALDDDEEEDDDDDDVVDGDEDCDSQEVRSKIDNDTSDNNANVKISEDRSQPPPTIEVTKEEEDSAKSHLEDLDASSDAMDVEA